MNTTGPQAIALSGCSEIREVCWSYVLIFFFFIGHLCSWHYSMVRGCTVGSSYLQSIMPSRSNWDSSPTWFWVGWRSSNGDYLIYGDAMQWRLVILGDGSHIYTSWVVDSNCLFWWLESRRLTSARLCPRSPNLELVAVALCWFMLCLSDTLWQSL